MKKPTPPVTDSSDLKNSLPDHLPVLLDEVLQYMAPADGGLYVDGTLGLGGHSEKILQACNPSGRVIGFEWDADALELASKRLAPYGRRFTPQHKSYAEITESLAEMDIGKVDGLLLDLGVSSLQFDTAPRGFSFQTDGPLDMRMDRNRPLTAREIINTYSKDALADIFYYFGEERQARRIAARITAERVAAPIETTAALARIIGEAVPKKFHPRKIHVATKVFQALRIAVNEELDNLTTILDRLTDIVKPGGRVCIITFHSLEDRLVKWRFRENPLLDVLTKKPVSPSQQEIERNPRSRSAKLRVVSIKNQG